LKISELRFLKGAAGRVLLDAKGGAGDQNPKPGLEGVKQIV
jgi:hypothetical protein